MKNRLFHLGNCNIDNVDFSMLDLVKRFIDMFMNCDLCISEVK